VKTSLLITFIENLSFLFKNVLMLFMLSGCLGSLEEVRNKTPLPSRGIPWQDSGESYLDHYNNLLNDFITTSSGYIKKARPEIQGYLNGIWKRLLGRMDYKSVTALEVYYYDDQQPFYLLSPDGRLILSIGLIEKYVRNQPLLSVILLEAILRIKHNYFYKIIFIPTGIITVEQMLSVLKLDLKSKTNINEWIYYYLKKNNGDVVSILDWVQVKNRNSLDFSLLNNNGYSPLEEEKVLKNIFLKGRNLELFHEEVSLSPKVFYRFRREAIEGREE